MENSLVLPEEVTKGMVVTEEEILALKVVDNDSYLKAGHYVDLRKALKKEIKDKLDPICDATNKAHKKATAFRKEQLDKLIPADKYLDNQMTTWNVEQERLRKIEEDRLRREAEKKAEEQQLADAMEAEAQGADEEAEAILNEPVQVAPPIVEKTVPKVSGQTMTTTWRYKVTDQNKIPRQYMIPDEKALNALVKAQKDRTNIPGIEVFAENKMRGVRQ